MRTSASASISDPVADECQHSSNYDGSFCAISIERIDDKPGYSQVGHSVQHAYGKWKGLRTDCYEGEQEACTQPIDGALRDFKVFGSRFRGGRKC